MMREEVSQQVQTSLQIRHIHETDYASKLSCRPGDMLMLEVCINNRGSKAAKNLSVSHMLRDYLAYVPDTMQTGQGVAKLLFRLLRWHVDSLEPGAEACLCLQLRVGEGNPDDVISLGATYTYQLEGVHGPLEALGATLYIQ